MGDAAPTSFGAIYAALNRLSPGEEMVYYSGPVPKDDDVRRMFGAAYMLYEAGGAGVSRFPRPRSKARDVRLRRM